MGLALGVMRLLRFALIGGAFLAGCSSFSTGSATASPVEDAGAPPVDAAPAPDAGVTSVDDAGVVTFPAGTSWESPNGAKWSTDAGGTTITMADKNHPILLVSPALPLLGDDYTVHATIKAMSKPVNDRTEFGLVLRGALDGPAFVFGTDYGGADQIFLGAITLSDGNPGGVVAVQSDAIVTSARYHLAATAQGSVLRGKIWQDGAPEPDWQVTKTNVPTSGGLVGVYSYFVTDAVFESLSVTVP